MTISFQRPCPKFWVNATSHELYRMDLQELLIHIFGTNSRTTIDFLKWLPSSYHAGLELCEQAAGKLAMLEAPITYSNEDCDRRQTMVSWAMTTVPAAMWSDFRNDEALRRRKAEQRAELQAM